MKRALLAFALLLVPIAAPAQESCPEDVFLLRNLYELRELMLLPSSGSWDFSERLNGQIDAIREPLGDGTYRWVDYSVPRSDGPVTRRDRLVNTADGTGDFDSLEASGTKIYAVRLVVPRKRSLFRANESLRIGMLRITTVTDGESSTREMPLDRWFSPDSSKTIDLDGIADRVTVSVAATTHAEDVGEALVEIHLLQAVPTDNPDNPHFDTLQVLRRLGSSWDPYVLELEIGRAEQRLFPEARPLPLLVVLPQLREVQRLLSSEEPADRNKAIEELSKALKSLQ